MENTNIYFAAGMYKDDHDNCEFRMVSNAATRNPYLTRDPDGLRHTAHHASLYQLSDDGEYAILVDRRNGGNAPSPAKVKLSHENKALIQQSINLDYFLDKEIL